MKNKVNTIIFDLGGVLIDWNPLYVYNTLIPDAERRKFFFDHICTHDWNLEQDAGRSLEAATAEKLAEFPEWETEIRAFYGRWVEMLGGPIQETVDLFAELRSRSDLRLLALTNWSNETFPIALERYDFLHWFEGIVVSGDEKTRKLYPEVSQILLQRYEVNPATAVFIDDNFQNVEAAKQEGIHGIHFQGAAGLKEALDKLV